MSETDIDMNEMQRQLEAPMPWIGMYVAAASLVCTLAMACDVFHGLQTNKLWFSSKYFSLNAFSLTLLSLVMKLPVDLTTQMCDVTDRLAKLSSLVFLSTAMANFLPSMGSMANKDVLLNVVALGVLVITVTVNECIQVIQMQFYLNGRLVFIEEILAICCMLVLLVMFCSTAVMIPSAKRYMETKYKEMHKEEVEIKEVFTSCKLRVLIEKYWVMAETSSPQFLIARSATCTASGFVGLFSFGVLGEAQIRMAMEYSTLDRSDSNYAWSTKWILLTQSIGVIVGTIAPSSRWFIAISRSRIGVESVVKVEGYWTQKMMEWKQSSVGFKIRHLKSRKVVHDVRELLLKLFISAQILTVLASKLAITFSSCITSPLVSCFQYILGSENHKVVTDAIRRDPKVENGRYVMLLDGEFELPMGTLKNICKDRDEIIQKGKTEKPKDLLELLRKSRDFNGVKEFDNHRVPFLNSQDLPYCWCLPVVTLTSIALALPNVKKHKSDSLLKSVAQGLCYVKLVDKNLDNKGGLANIRSAADVVGRNVELYHKWQDNDLLEISLKGKHSVDVLQELGDKAEKTVLDFKKDAKDCLMKNPHNWPGDVIAANAMYRISRTILLMGPHDKTDEEVFEQISIMIADILAACLTNLARVITIKCHRISIEKRDKSVRGAAFLLGETEEIIGLLQQRQFPELLNPGQAAYIEMWRAVINQDTYNCNQDHFVSRHSCEKPINIDIAIEVEELSHE